MSPQKIESISQLTLKSKQISIDAGDFEMCLNFASILNQEEVYINATKFLKKESGKKVRVEDYLRTNPTKEYIIALEDDYFKSGVGATIKKGTHFRKAGRYGGTWMCKLLFLDFVRWVDPRFNIACNKILLQMFTQADELSNSRQQLKEIQRPYTDIIKKHLVDTGIKTDSVYTQMAVQIKRFIGTPDKRDAYTSEQLKTAKSIMEEYKGMIVHGGYESIGKMNDYIATTELNISGWERKSRKKITNYADEIVDQH